MSGITSVLPLPRSFATPYSSAYVRYEGEGWYRGLISHDQQTIKIDGTSYGFDAKVDEFVEATAATTAFLARHAGSVLVRVAQSQVDYLVSDGTMTLENLITMLNALLFRAGRPRLPPVHEDDALYMLYDAAKMCERGVLELTTV